MISKKIFFRCLSVLIFAGLVSGLRLPGFAQEASKKKKKPLSQERSEIFQADTDIIDVPTAAVLDYGSFLGRARFFSRGGVLGHLSFGIFQRLNLGASLYADGLVGNDSNVRLVRPELQVKFRFYDGSRYLPAFALGFDGQGTVYDTVSKQYSEQERGLYLVASRELGIPQLMGNLGINMSDFDNNRVFTFLGATFNIEDKVALMAEWDNVRSVDDSRFNAGLRIYATPFLQIDLAGRGIGRGGTFSSGIRKDWERIVQLKYTTNF